MRKSLLWLCMTLILSVAGAAEAWSGKVVAVADGDTLSVLRDGQSVKIRLWGIDCPESRQDFGTAAKKFLGQQAHGKTATVHERGRDRYGRVVAVVEVDGAGLNHALIEAGLAWVYRQYCREPEHSAWEAVEANAREQQLGLWAHPHPVPPWEWRRDHSAARATRSPTNRDAHTFPPSLAKERQTDGDDGAARMSAVASTASLRGNIRSRIVHAPTCSAYTAKNCVREFSDPDSADGAGFRPCKKCLAAPTPRSITPSKAA